MKCMNSSKQHTKPEKKFPDTQTIFGTTESILPKENELHFCPIIICFDLFCFVFAKACIMIVLAEHEYAGDIQDEQENVCINDWIEK